VWRGGGFGGLKLKKLKIKGKSEKVKLILPFHLLIYIQMKSAKTASTPSTLTAF
jgi:hypothetical protein